MNTMIDRFAGLDTAVAQSETIALAPGEVRVLAADEVLLLTAGELLLHRSERLLDVLEAPAVLGLAEALAGVSVAGRVRARGTASLVRIAGDDLRAAMLSDTALRHRVATHLARAVVDGERARLELLASHDDFFPAQPGGLLLPGPYRFGPYRALQLVMEAAPGQLDVLLPEGLARAPGLGGRYLVVVNDIENCVCEHPTSDRRAHAYREVVPFIPCVARNGLLGLYTPEVYPGAYMPILLGREVYGFPKRLARIHLGVRRVDLLVDHDVLLHARWTDEIAVTASGFVEALALALLPAGAAAAPLARLLGGFTGLAGATGVDASALTSRVFVRKRIRAADSLELDRHAIDELVEVPFAVFHVGALARLEGVHAEVGAAGRVFPGRVLAGFSCTIGFRMEKGRVVRDYREIPARRGLLTRLAGSWAR